SCHQYSHRAVFEFFGHTAQQYVGTGTMSVHPRFIAQHHNVTQGQTLHLHVAAARTNQDSSCLQQIARLSFLHAQRANFIQTACKHVGEPLWHVLHHHNRGREVGRQLRQHEFESLRTSSRNSDSNDFVGSSRRRGCFF